MDDFAGRVAVITGAGRGIGRGIALRCAREGMKIVLAGYGLDSITQTAADLEALGAETLVIQTDVSRLDDVENLARKSFEKFGAVHLLVNNAGVTTAGSIVGMTMDDWNWMMGVNFYGVLYGIRAFVPRMKEQVEGHVVNVSSLRGVMGAQGASPAYHVSKHAVVALSEALYDELRGTSLRVSVYCPGWVTTDLDTAHRSRPARFSDSAHPQFATDQWRQTIRASLDKGYSVEKSADILFEGLRKDRFYIGVRGFTEQLPGLPGWVRARAEHIINETNP